MARMRPRTLPLLMVAATLVTIAPLAVARTLKIATVVPDGSAWMKEMREAGKLVEERTAGRVKLKFYPGGIMGNDKTVLRKMRAGQLHGGAFTSGSLAQIYPETELYSLPLMFRSYDEVDYVRARMDADIRAGLERNGLVALAVSDGGFAHLLSQKPVREVSDLKGTKVWALEEDIMSRTALEIAGVSAIPLPLADVYTGLQTGLIDTVAAPARGAIAFQWHTKVKYFTDVPLMYLIGVLAVDAKTFSKLAPEDQAVLREVVGEAGLRLDEQNRLGDENAKEALKKQGIEFVGATSDAELQRWRDIAQEAVVRLRARNIYSNEMIDTIQGHLETYRSQAQAANEQ